jgi:perosamine synthetase
MTNDLAILGGAPVRTAQLPYGRHSIDEDDVAAVTATLRSAFLTTGPEVTAFEDEFAAMTGVEHAVALSSGTAALHAALAALGLGPGDEVIVPVMTFAATANAVLMVGARPVLADVEPSTLLIDPRDAASRVSSRTRAVVAMDYGGQPADYGTLHQLAADHGLTVVADACHSLGANYRDHPVGGLAALSTFSFHAVKSLTTGEGGMLTTADAEVAQRVRSFRNHCLSTDAAARSSSRTWEYRIDRMGYNYRLSALQCALGRSQLKKLRGWINRRRAIAAQYDQAFADLEGIAPLAHRPDRSHAYHLYVVMLDRSKLSADRRTIFEALHAEGIGVNVHYIPLHLQPLFQQTCRVDRGAFPVAESAYASMLTLPLFPAMTAQDVADVIAAVRKVMQHYVR